MCSSDLVTSAERALTEAVEREAAAEMDLAKGAADNRTDLTRRADAARDARESAVVDLERAQRRADILANALGGDDERIASAAQQIRAAMTGLSHELATDHLKRLRAAVLPILPVLAEGYGIDSLFQISGHPLPAVLSKFQIPNPDLDVETWLARIRLGSRHVGLLVDGQQPHNVEPPASVAQMAGAIAPAHKALSALDEILNAQRRRRLEAERRHPEPAREPIVTITYGDGSQVPDGASIWHSPT